MATETKRVTVKELQAEIQDLRTLIAAMMEEMAEYTAKNRRFNCAVYLALWPGGPHEERARLTLSEDAY